MRRPPESPEYREAVRLHSEGYWPIATYPHDAPDPKDRKRPIGKAWGLERWTLERLDSAFRDFPGAGVGICFGPGRAPDGRWLIDVEIDGEGAEPALAGLFGGEVVETVGWSSARGGHRLFVLDEAEALRLLDVVARFGEEGKGHRRGVWHLPSAPGLEFRLGGYKEAGRGR